MDYYESNKKNQFKDIQLQLHATSSVSNPYTFSIQGNKSFSGICTLSDVEQVLFDGNVAIGKSIEITIPNNVKVLKVLVKYGILINKNSSIEWSWHSFNDNSMSYSAYTNYVGVTPNKTYILGSFVYYYESNGSISIKISYSASINNHKVLTSDY